MACEKIIEIDLGEAKTKMVVNAVLQEDSIIKINLSRSRHILDNAAVSYINDAEVKLFENDVFIGNLVYSQNGFYQINHFPKRAYEYKIEVKHDIFDDVFAYTSILNSVPILSVDTLTGFGQYNNEVMHFSIRLNDPPGEKNYYKLSLKNKFLGEMWNPDLIVYDTLYVTEDTVIVHTSYGGYELAEFYENIWFSSEDIIFSEYSYFNSYFSDEIFDGKSYNIRVTVDKWNFRGETNMVYVELASISKELYLYYISLSKHMYNQGDPFAEPVIVFTNIENGIGVFGSATYHRDSLQIAGKEFDPWFYY